MSQGKCKSCGAPVFFERHYSTGNPMIFDAQWRDGGTGWTMTPAGAQSIRDAKPGHGNRVYVTHFSTCPNAAEHRKPKEDPLPPAHHNAPETSQEAADAIAESTADLREKLYAFLETRREQGATDQEMQEALGMGPQTQSPRRLELLHAGRIHDTGKKRKTRAGRNAVVWAIGSKPEAKEPSKAETGSLW